jgi:hypothetical protein
MTIKRRVGTLARTGVSTAVSAVRHPIGTASLAAGLAKGAAEASVYLVRTTITGTPPAPAREDLGESVSEPVEEPLEDEKPVEDPRDNIPGPDLATFPPPEPGDLPEPVVIEAVTEPGEAFHTEPKAASRASAHGEHAGDREEAQGYVDDILDEDFGGRTTT